MLNEELQNAVEIAVDTQDQDPEPHENGAIHDEGERVDQALEYEHEEPSMALTNPRIVNATRVIAAESVQAEEVPTIPLSSLEVINALRPEISVHPIVDTQAVSSPTPLVAQPFAYRRDWKESVRLWWRGMRLNYLSLSLMPILLGSLLAWISTITVKKPLVSFHLGSFHFAHFLGLIVAVLILQLGAHLINDYYDYLHGVDTSNTFGSGELLRQGHVKPMQVLIVGLVLLGLGAVIEGIAGLGGGLFFYLFGILALLCSYFYSATPYSLAALGLGEFVGFLVFGPLLTLSAYMVQMGPHFPPARVLGYSLPLGLLAAAVLHANNMRDIEGDALAKKHTLATLLKLPISRIFYFLLLLASYAILIGLAIPHKAPHFILLALWTFPTFMLAITGIMRTNAPAGFHLVLRQTLKLQRNFVILLMIGLLVTACLGIVWAPALLQSLR